MSRTHISHALRIAAAALLVASSVCAAQPPAPPSPRDGSTDRSGSTQPGGGRVRGEREFLRQLMALPPGERRVRLRAYLAERQERAQRTHDALTKAIKAVDEGAPMDDLSALIPQEAREGRGGGSAFPLGPAMDGGSPQPSNDNTDELGPVPMPGMGGPGNGAPRGGAGGGRPEDNAPKAFEGPITDDDRAVVNEFMSSVAPHLRERFRLLERSKPEEAELKLREMLTRIRWLIDLRKADRAAYDLRLKDMRHGHEAFAAAIELAGANTRAASEADRSALTERMRTALGEQYRVRGELIGKEISRQESELAQRKADQGKRAETREATIARTMQKLTERASEWIKRRERGKKARDDSAN